MAKKKPGKATRETDDELEAQAEITPQDIIEAQAAARKHGSKLFNELLNAQKAGNAL